MNTPIIVVKWLAKQSCTFRAHFELANLENRGNFVEMIELSTWYSKEIIEVVLQNSPLYAKCTTSNIQKKLLNILANKVQKKDKWESGDDTFGIFIDEALDESDKEVNLISLVTLHHHLFPHRCHLMLLPLPSSWAYWEDDISLYMSRLLALIIND